MGDSKIEWTDATWNPVVGCSRVSAGCEHCYAERVAHRGMTEAHRGLTVLGKKGPRWTGEVRCLPERLDEPLRWRKPRKVFVNSMSDLFHERVPFEFVAAVFGVMAAAPQHVFQVLTKRPERAREFFAWLERVVQVRLAAAPPREIGWQLSPRDHCAQTAMRLTTSDRSAWLARSGGDVWPLPNVWLGVSVEDQATADERIPVLLTLPAAVRWVSYEPALGAVDFGPGMERSRCPSCGWECAGRQAAPGSRYDWCHGCANDCPVTTRLDWIVVGGESGPGARPFDLAWARSTIAQGRAAGVPVFVKQLGARPVWSFDVRRDPQPSPSVAVRESSLLPLRDRKGGDMEEWPADLRVREVPSVGAVA